MYLPPPVPWSHSAAYSKNSTHEVTSRHFGARSPLDKLTFLLLWLFTFSVPFERVIMVPGIGTISRVLGLLLVPCAILAIMARGSIRALALPHYLMIIFVTWAGVTCIWSISSDALALWLTELQCLAIALIMWQFVVGLCLRKLMAAYALGAIPSFVSTAGRVLEHHATSWQRYSATGFDPNDLSLTIAISIPLAYYLFLCSKGIRAAV